MPKPQAKIIVLTGATRGCGRALVDRVVELGHTVLGCGRSAERIADFKQRLPTPHDFAVVDVAEDAAVAAWAARLLQAYGPPDLLINNAALMNRNDALWQLSAQEFDPVVDVNIKGVANLIRHFVPAMVKRERGVIVNISSGWGRSTAADVAPYCATKWAIEGLTKALAQELPRGMAAVPLNPGIIDTDMLRESFGDSAGNYPSAEHWSHTAAPYILALGPGDNGLSRTIPQ